MKHCKSVILFTLFLLFITAGTHAQKGTQADTASILKLINDGSKIWNTQPEKAQELVNDALARSIAANYRKGIVIAYARLGRWNFGSNINKSVEFAQKALAMFDNNVIAPETKADMHLLLAEAYDEQGHTDSSAYYYYLLGDEVQSGNITKPDFMIDIYTKLAIFWMNTYNGVNGDTKNTETLKSYVGKVKKYASQIEDPEDAISKTYFIQGIYYHYTNYDSARYFYHKFLDAREKLKNIGLPRKISTLANIADTYLMGNQPDQAMPYINQVKDLCKTPERAGHLGFYLAFVGLMEGKALYQQKKYASAITVLHTSLEQMKATGGHLRAEVVESYKIMAACYEALGNYTAALTNKNTYITLNDSLSRKEKMDMISRLEIRYRISEKNQELSQQRFAIAQAQNKIKKRNIFIAGVLVLFLFLAMLLVVWRRKNLHKQRLQQRNIENLQQKMKIERLNATIAGEEKERNRIARELHDGIGGLLTAAKLNFELFKKNILPENKSDFDNGVKLLEDAGIELRQAARNLMPQVLLQDGLVKAVEAFCNDVSQRTDTHIRFQALGDRKSIDKHLELTLYRIIQELMHNIIKHSEARNAIVQINFQDDGGLTVTVEDDGVGINQTKLTHVSSGGGMGLKNIEERVKESGGKLDITSEAGQGTSFFIEFESQ